jgi:hypothetical protein
MRFAFDYYTIYPTPASVVPTSPVVSAVQSIRRKERQLLRKRPQNLPITHIDTGQFIIIEEDEGYRRKNQGHSYIQGQRAYEQSCSCGRTLIWGREATACSGEEDGRHGAKYWWREVKCCECREDGKAYMSLRHFQWIIVSVAQSRRGRERNEQRSDSMRRWSRCWLPYRNAKPKPLPKAS